MVAEDARRPGPEDGPAHPRWIVAATMLASGLAFVDGSVTNVALPAMGADLRSDPASLPWIINAYLLPLAALLLLGGALGDQFGRRRMLIVGIAVFAAASAGCAVAPDTTVFLAARALQGVGAAILMPNSLGILGATFRGEERGRAVGTWAAMGAIVSAVGPPLGGWLVDTVGWRPIFYLNLPVAAAAIVVAARFVPAGEGARGGLDWIGGMLATAGLGALTWALTSWSTRHAALPTILAGVAVGGLLIAVFLWNERRLGAGAMMPFSLFASRPFVGLTLLTLLLYGALGGLLVLLPSVLIEVGNYTTTEAGLALLPFSIVVGLGSRIAGRLSARFGGRWPLTLGPVIVGAGFAVLATADPAGGYWTNVLPGVGVVAFGMAGAVAPLTTAVLSSVDDRHTGTASGFNSAIARTGGLVATALAGAVLTAPASGMTAAFGTAATVAAVMALLAGGCAYATLGRRPETPPA